MPVQHTSRTGKTYYLHTGQKRGGGIQYFFSTKRTGALAERVPDGFEIYESVRGQVFLRRTVPKLIHDEETACGKIPGPRSPGAISLEYFHRAWAFAALTRRLVVLWRSGERLWPAGGSCGSSVPRLRDWRVARVPSADA
jgi:hypothetical protein